MAPTCGPLRPVVLAWLVLTVYQATAAAASLQPAPPGGAYDYDLFVIGGGSGGIACAKEAGRLGAKVGLCDFVRPSPRGSKWGLGGTCVNVGCIPKKLMHYAGQLRHVLELDAPAYGFDLSKAEQKNKKKEEDPHRPAPTRVTHSWRALVQGVQNHVRSLNFGYRAALTKARVKYFNSKGSLSGGHEIVLTDAKGRARTVTARHIVLATGGRPHVPDNFEGAEEHAITSDDLFSLDSPPGRTLVIGGGYVALECAGFLASLGYETSVMLRSIPLRGFDAECAELVLNSVGETGAGATILRSAVPRRVERDATTGRLRVFWRRTVAADDGEEAGSGETTAIDEEGEFDTVLVATGRRPESAALNLPSVGLDVRADGKLETHHETSAVAHVHAIGDLASEAPNGRPELTPVAAKAGVLLARRLCGAADAAGAAANAAGAAGAAGEAEWAAAAAAAAAAADAAAVERAGLDPLHVATAVFSPLEYACVGLSEEDARAALGDERLEAYHLRYAPLEWSLVGGRVHGGAPPCLVKVLCDREEGERIVGLHLVGEHAAEIMQGFALAIRLGATKSDLDATIGIHPSSAEELVHVSVTKRSGEDAAKAGC